VHVLIVKLSSLGDVVHAMPVVHDILSAHPGAHIDWVVEPSFAPLVRRVPGVRQVFECAQRRWRQAWWTQTVRVQWQAFRAQLRTQHYDAIIDLQGLTKSAVIACMARGRRYGLANQTQGSSHEWPARYLVHEAITVPTHIHAVERARVLAARALHYTFSGPPQYGLQGRHPPQIPPAVALVHGTSRDDKLWPQEHWLALGQHFLAAQWQVALPHAGTVELARAQSLAQALGPGACVWPEMSLDALLDHLGACRGVIGVDSGLSHMAAALNLPHVQLYNFPTAWRTGPSLGHQVSLQGRPVPTAVWAAWQEVLGAVD
jgi:heptosyltransferase I